MIEKAKYDELLDKMKTFYESDEVIVDDSVISVYDLITATNKELKPLRGLFNNQKIILKINKSYSYSVSLKQCIKYLFKQPVFEVISFQKPVRDILVKIDEDGVCSLTFQLNTIQQGQNTFGSLTIKKDKNNGGIFIKQMSALTGHLFERESIDQFLNHNEEIINEMLTILETFYNDFNVSISRKRIFSKVSSQVLTDGFFEIFLDSQNGFVDYSVKLANDDDNEVFNQEWVRRTSLAKIFAVNEETYLKKIMIPISSLNSFYKKVVEKIYEKNEVIDEEIESKYQNLKNILNDVYSREDTFSNSEVISVYDLIEATNNSLSDINCLLYSEEFLDRINKRYLYVLNSFIRYVKLGSKIDSSIKPYINNKGDFILELNINTGDSVLGLIFGKHNGDNDIFISENYSIKLNEKDIKKFIDNNLDIINEIFRIMEKAYNELGVMALRSGDLIFIGCENGFEQSVNDDLFEFKLNVNRGDVIYSFKLINEELERVFNFELYGQKSLKEDFEANSEEYLKKIMVPVESLNPFYKKIIDLYYGNYKVKRLKKD